MPRFTPQVDGPSRKLRDAALELEKKSAPKLGTVNAEGFQNRSPDRTLGFPDIEGRNEGPLKSPTASMKPLPRLPGYTGSQLSQVQKGVKPVPDFANPFHESCQAPITA